MPAKATSATKEGKVAATPRASASKAATIKMEPSTAKKSSGRPSRGKPAEESEETEIAAVTVKAEVLDDEAAVKDEAGPSTKKAKVVVVKQTTSSVKKPLRIKVCELHNDPRLQHFSMKLRLAIMAALEVATIDAPVVVLHWQLEAAGGRWAAWPAAHRTHKAVRQKLVHLGAINRDEDPDHVIAFRTFSALLMARMKMQGDPKWALAYGRPEAFVALHGGVACPAIAESMTFGKAWGRTYEIMSQKWQFFHQH